MKIYWERESIRSNGRRREKEGEILCTRLFPLGKDLKLKKKWVGGEEIKLDGKYTVPLALNLLQSGRYCPLIESTIMPSITIFIIWFVRVF